MLLDGLHTPCEVQGLQLEDTAQLPCCPSNGTTGCCTTSTDLLWLQHPLNTCYAFKLIFATISFPLTQSPFPRPLMSTLGIQHPETFAGGRPPGTSHLRIFFNLAIQPKSLCNCSGSKAGTQASFFLPPKSILSPSYHLQDCPKCLDCPGGNHLELFLLRLYVKVQLHNSFWGSRKTMFHS